MFIRLLLAPIAVALGLTPPTDPNATVDTTATRLDAAGKPLPDDGPSPQDNSGGPQLPDAGPFVIPDGKGGMIYGCRIPAGMATEGPDQTVNDGSGTPGADNTLKTYGFTSDAGRAFAFRLRLNSAGGAEGFGGDYTPGQ